VIDTITGELVNAGNEYSAETFVYFLNELHDENEELKQTIETQNFNYENAKGIIHSSEHQIQNLQDENEQLKQENQELSHFKLSIKAFAECNENINRKTLNELIELINYD